MQNLKDLILETPVGPKPGSEVMKGEVCGI